MRADPRIVAAKGVRKVTMLRHVVERDGLLAAVQRALHVAAKMRGRELVLYWSNLERDQKIAFRLDLICRVPGEYLGPASRAYLYYNAEQKCWIEPLRVAIKPKAD